MKKSIKIITGTILVIIIFAFFYLIFVADRFILCLFPVKQTSFSQWLKLTKINGGVKINENISSSIIRVFVVYFLIYLFFF